MALQRHVPAAPETQLLRAAAAACRRCRTRLHTPLAAACGLLSASQCGRQQQAALGKATAALIGSSSGLDSEASPKRRQRPRVNGAGHRQRLLALRLPIAVAIAEPAVTANQLCPPPRLPLSRGRPACGGCEPAAGSPPNPLPTHSPGAPSLVVQPQPSTHCGLQRGHLHAALPGVPGLAVHPSTHPCGPAARAAAVRAPPGGSGP